MTRYARHRLYRMDDLGRSKAEAATHALVREWQDT